MEKYHSSRCDEIIFITKADATKYISEESKHFRFHLRDDYLVWLIKELFIWKSNNISSVEAVSAEVEMKCPACFEITDEIPLSLEQFSIVNECNKSIPIHVQLLFESFLNKDFIRWCDKKDVYIKEKHKYLYPLYDSLTFSQSTIYRGLSRTEHKGTYDE